VARWPGQSCCRKRQLQYQQQQQQYQQQYPLQYQLQQQQQVTEEQYQQLYQQQQEAIGAGNAEQLQPVSVLAAGAAPPPALALPSGASTAIFGAAWERTAGGDAVLSEPRTGTLL